MVGDILQPTHLLFILVVALLVLGPKRLPEVGRQLGSGLRDFRAALSGERIDRDEQPPTQSFQPAAAPFAESQVEPVAHVEPDYTTDPALDHDAQSLGPERFESPVPEHGSADKPADSAPVESESELAAEPVGSAPVESEFTVEPVGSSASDESEPGPEPVASPSPAESEPVAEPVTPSVPAESEASADGHELPLEPPQPADPHS